MQALHQAELDNATCVTVYGPSTEVKQNAVCTEMSTKDLGVLTDIIYDQASCNEKCKHTADCGNFMLGVAGTTFSGSCQLLKAGCTFTTNANSKFHAYATSTTANVTCTSTEVTNSTVSNHINYTDVAARLENLTETITDLKEEILHEKEVYEEAHETYEEELHEANELKEEIITEKEVLSETETNERHTHEEAR